MSEQPTQVTDRHFRYIAERTAREDDFLRDLRAAARDEGIPAIWIAPEQASLAQILLKLAGARTVVEVGTLVGYSAIWMARALPPGGRVDTIEISSRHADFAERWIARSDAAGKIVVHRGPGNEVLCRFPADSCDAAFIDADKENYPRYLEESLRIVRPGGLIMVDNAFAFGELFSGDGSPGVQAVRRFNDLMAGDSRVDGIIVPLGDGLWVGVKR
jgi:predicted O-methyltransferase YrrM